MLGVPYMGSKRKIASKLLDFIVINNPSCKYFYDLFGGGGAMSFAALKYSQIERVHYNEINTGVVELIKKITKDGIPDIFFNWVTRDTFNAHKNTKDWYGGLVKTCWSFGNNQKDYIFGKNIEALKKEAHEYLMQNGYDGTQKTRIDLIKKFKLDKNIICNFQLQQLQQLECLEQLERLEQLELTNLSYEEVNIKTPIEETIIYIDPPYKNTKGYQEKVDFDKLTKWILNSPYKIYVSSYEYEELHEVTSIKHRCTLSSIKNNEVTEKLFCNRSD